MGRIASFFFPLALLLLVFLTVCLLAPYNPDVYRAGDSQWTTLEGQQSLQSRLGYASLLAAGFVADTGSPYSVAVQKPPCEGMGPAIPGKIPLGGEEALDVGNLALALVAAEQYNRTAVRRFLERLYALGIYGLTGGLPDISLGPAQIRPSAMREIDPTATDAAILEFAGQRMRQPLGRLAAGGPIRPGRRGGQEDDPGRGHRCRRRALCRHPQERQRQSALHRHRRRRLFPAGPIGAGVTSGTSSADRIARPAPIP